jgi:predicted nucleic acid-binding protein
LSFVLDGSVALANAFADERTPETNAAMDRAAAERAPVPPIWRLEIANGLLAGARRGRMSRQTMADVLAEFTRMDLAIDPDCDAHAWSATVRLSEKHALTAYDASYLELALRRPLPLATLDAALARAARAEGVALVL